MSVTFDAVGTATDTSSASPATLTTLTIGAGSQRALVVQLVFCGTACSETAPAGIAVVWDPSGANQSLTQIGTITGKNGQIVQLWGLVNPASGNKTLQVSWTAATHEVMIQATSWTGVDQTGGATSFAHFNSAQDAASGSTGASVTITSATGNAVVAVTAAGSFAAISAVNNTQTFLTHGLGNLEAGGNRAAGAATVAMTGTYAASENWVIAGVDIVAASAGGGVTTAQEAGIFSQALSSGVIGRVDA